MDQQTRDNITHELAVAFAIDERMITAPEGAAPRIDSPFEGRMRQSEEPGWKLMATSLSTANRVAEFINREAGNRIICIPAAPRGRFTHLFFGEKSIEKLGAGIFIDLLKRNKEIIGVFLKPALGEEMDAATARASQPGLSTEKGWPRRG